ncbi:adenylate/guanylate cyclase domain-containing protein [Acuticoccus sediminis]|uniref:adenylate/guanylate cyclase domain-containing protein n=1 Tax=Acuticoccus sediminis TaxID=2184697 RepID=UPI001CFF1637|nr:adenylate/guanylate cyclase domain-containing protein [Acuticoccus sediminis]
MSDVRERCGVELDPVLDWVIAKGVEGIEERDLVDGFARRCRETGLPFHRIIIFADMLDPTFEGRAVQWRDDGEAPQIREYTSTAEGEAAEAWQRTPFFALSQSNDVEFRVRIGLGERTGAHMIEDFAREGATDYIAFMHRIGENAIIGEMDAVYSHYTTRQAGGFTDAQLARLRQLVKALSLAFKSLTIARMTRTLAHVYLGHGAAETVLTGRILRGMAQRIEAVLWFSDLRSYTAISDAAHPGQIIPLLNDYADAAMTAIDKAGGETMKLIGDGVLAVFRDGDTGTCAARALAAERAFRTALADVSSRRRNEGLPVTDAYVALHCGEVFYGNIGAAHRLDFTVVGPAVNEVSRIATLCRSVDRTFLVSEAFHDALAYEERSDLVSTGRFALRGVGRAQHLFTVDPALRDPAG